MTRLYAGLEYVENDKRITREADGDFLYCLQRGLLHGLRELGVITEWQLHRAEEKLHRTDHTAP